MIPWRCPSGTAPVVMLRRWSPRGDALAGGFEAVLEHLRGTTRPHLLSWEYAHPAARSQALGLTLALAKTQENVPAGEGSGTSPTILQLPSAPRRAEVGRGQQDFCGEAQTKLEQKQQQQERGGAAL